ncbi:MAG: glycosyltransferase [Candidatus Omnitrophica bacterium]|nr:glycosyltransferase [Candidatus Omnitrophota bacterium]
MRILNIIPYWGYDVGGPFVNTANIAANLTLLGHKSSVITTSERPGEYTESYSWMVGTRRVDFPICVCKRRAGKMYFSSDFKKKFMNEAPKNDAVLIHGLWNFPDTYAAFFCNKHGIPYHVFTYAMMSYWSFSHNFFRKKAYLAFFERKNLNNARSILIMDPLEAKVLEKVGVTTEKILLPNAINKEEIILCGRNRRAAGYVPREETRLLYLGRIHPKKGLIFLIKAVESLAKSGHKVRLVVAGPRQDPAYFKAILNIVKNRGLESFVSFADTVYGEKKKELFSNSDIFVLPTMDEARGPLALLEAMSYGLPVITTSGCKMPEIDNEMGYVVDRNPEEIAGAVIKLAGNRKLSEKMGTNAYNYVLENFTWEKNIEDLLGIIRKTLTGRA